MYCNNLILIECLGLRLGVIIGVAVQIMCAVNFEQLVVSAGDESDLRGISPAIIHWTQKTLDPFMNGLKILDPFMNGNLICCNGAILLPEGNVCLIISVSRGLE